MLTALDVEGRRVEATRDLAPGEYRCPGCADELIVKRGRVVSAHFAHRPPADCDLALETAAHLRAKALLAREVRAVGLACDVEVSLSNVRRRLDVAVHLENGWRVALEVQATAISVEEMKARMGDHRAAGYVTGWVFTSNRCKKLLEVAPGEEVRVPGDLAYAWNRFRVPLNVLDVVSEQMYRITFDTVVRYGEDYYEPGGDGEMATASDRTLTRTFVIGREHTGFTPTLMPGRYAGQFGVTFPLSPYGH